MKSVDCADFCYVLYIFVEWNILIFLNVYHEILNFLISCWICCNLAHREPSHLHPNLIWISCPLSDDSDDENLLNRSDYSCPEDIDENELRIAEQLDVDEELDQKSRKLKVTVMNVRSIIHVSIVLHMPVMLIPDERLILIYFVIFFWTWTMLNLVTGQWSSYNI